MQSRKRKHITLTSMRKNLHSFLRFRTAAWFTRNVSITGLWNRALNRRVHFFFLKRFSTHQRVTSRQFWESTERPTLWSATARLGFLEFKWQPNFWRRARQVIAWWSPQRKRIGCYATPITNGD